MRTIADKCLPRKPFGISSNFSSWTATGYICTSKAIKKRCIKEDSFTDKSSILYKWKVCTGATISEGNFKEDKHNKIRVISTMFIIEPKELCTESYVVVNYFDTREHAHNFLSYMKTKFFRFMLRITTVTQNISKNCFTFVPDVEDYTKPWTDKALYKKYKLSQEEIAYIESKIKEL